MVGPATLVAFCWFGEKVQEATDLGGPVRDCSLGFGEKEQLYLQVL